MKNPITREEFQIAQRECYKKNIDPIMCKIDKLDKKLDREFEKVFDKVIEMPEKLENRFDSKYAEKHTEKEVEKIATTVKSMSKEINMFKGGFNTVKWILGVVGFTNIILIIRTFM